MGNRARFFTDVVSIDAWQDTFEESGSRARIFADVLFRTARMGGEKECPVSFRLSLRRAEIHLIVPRTEQIEIDKHSVARTAYEEPKQRSITTESSTEFSDSSEVSGGVAVPTDGKGKLEGRGSIRHGGKRSQRERIEETSTDFTMRVSCSRSPEDNYRWEVESMDRGALSGTPWDPTVPRATLIDTSERAIFDLPPGGVRFEARCAREDLIITDVSYKDPNLLDRIKDSAFPERKKMVVVQYIRDELLKEGLEASNIEDRFGLITLSSAFATELDVVKN